MPHGGAFVPRGSGGIQFVFGEEGGSGGGLGFINNRVSSKITNLKVSDIVNGFSNDAVALLLLVVNATAAFKD